MKIAREKLEIATLSLLMSGRPKLIWRACQAEVQQHDSQLCGDPLYVCMTARGSRDNGQ